MDKAKMDTLVAEALQRSKGQIRTMAADNSDMAALAMLDVVDRLGDKGEDRDMMLTVLMLAGMRVNGFGKAASSATNSALLQLMQALGMRPLF